MSGPGAQPSGGVPRDDGVKVILKKGESLNQRNTKPIEWDEDNLEYNEANKSATMKIDEPKTPYHAPLEFDGGDGELPGGEGDDFLLGGGLDGDMGDVSMLGGCQEGQQPMPSPDPPPIEDVQFQDTSPRPSLPNLDMGEGWRDSEDGGVRVEVELTEEEKEAKKKAFEAKRKGHYNEAEMLARARAMMAEEDDEDEDED